MATRVRSQRLPAAMCQLERGGIHEPDVKTMAIIASQQRRVNTTNDVMDDEKLSLKMARGSWRYLVRRVQRRDVKEHGTDDEEDEKQSVQKDGTIPALPDPNGNQIHGNAVEGDPFQKEVVIPNHESLRHGSKPQVEIHACPYEKTSL